MVIRQARHTPKTREEWDVLYGRVASRLEGGRWEKSETSQGGEVPVYLLGLLLQDPTIRRSCDVFGLAEQLLQVADESGELWNPELDQVLRRDSAVHGSLYSHLLGHTANPVALDCLARIEGTGAYLARHEQETRALWEMANSPENGTLSGWTLYALGRGLPLGDVAQAKNSGARGVKSPYFWAGRFVRGDQDQGDAYDHVLGAHGWGEDGAVLREAHRISAALIFRSGEMTGNHWRKLVEHLSSRLADPLGSRLDRDLVQMIIASNGAPEWVINSFVWAGIELKRCLQSHQASELTSSLATQALVTGRYNDPPNDEDSPCTEYESEERGPGWVPVVSRSISSAKLHEFPLTRVRHALVPSGAHSAAPVETASCWWDTDGMSAGSVEVNASAEWTYMGRAYSEDPVLREYEEALLDGLVRPNPEELVDLAGLGPVRGVEVPPPHGAPTIPEAPLVGLDTLFRRPEMTPDEVTQVLTIGRHRVDVSRQNADDKETEEEKGGILRAVAEKRAKLFAGMIRWVATSPEYSKYAQVSRRLPELHPDSPWEALEIHLPYAPEGTASAYLDTYAGYKELDDSRLLDQLRRIERSQGGLAHLAPARETVERMLKSSLAELRGYGFHIAGRCRPSRTDGS